MGHLTEVLLFGAPVVTGRAHQRTWRLGDREIDLGNRTLSGEIGYERVTAVPSGHYDEEAKSWVDEVQAVETIPRSPFVIDAETRTLTFLEYSDFDPKTVAGVFTSLLRRGEREREGGATVEWDVEAVLDETEFLTWIQEAESLQHVEFTAKLPNPSGMDQFDPIWDRLEARKASKIREIMEAAVPEQGLIGIADDEVARAYIAMAGHGYGNIRARRLRNNRVERFNQESRVKRRPLDVVPSSWRAAFVSLAERLRGERTNDGS